MVKLLRPGRVVVVTAGRFAGKKGIVLSANDSGKDRKFGHAIVAGIQTPPRKVHKRMNKKRVERRSRIKTFAKTINFNHLMPTRYIVSTDLDIAGMTERVNASRKDVDDKKKALKGIKTPKTKDDKEIKARQQDIDACRKTIKKEIQSVLQEKFMNPMNEKTKKVSKDILFLRKKLRF